MEKYLLVALGGAIGATARFATVTWVARRLGPGFPWGTVAVNVLGSFVMGIAFAVLIERMPAGAARLAPLVMAGVLGGFTTFSAFSLDVLQLLERERWMAAGGYVSASVMLSLLGLWAGLVMTRGLLS